ncbi:MAG: recombination-associated protein RdgC [Desulfobacterales bacterium]|uniref:Recombination-associated protein RdgC n=1 Tax=Candidatus Desulfatibia vada TaxID=2841696 RepID=A0A8J6NZ63_9BACT|nr:recombination-associated protein RdgC [Candidatus Desulfatibia vada]
MGLLSSSVSITRYRVEGNLEKPVIETVTAALKKDSISEIDDHASELTVGWTSFDNPYQPSFEGSSFVFGTYLIFSLRIDKKNIPSKIIKKYCAIEMAKKMEVTGRKYLAKNEKKMIKDHVFNVLSLRVPATPNIYDVLWNYEDASLWFFSNLKVANEKLESLFAESMKLKLIRLFPYTIAQLTAGLSDLELDVLAQLTPAKFTE